MLIIHFKKNGKVEMIPTGYPGEACRAITGYFGKFITGSVTADAPTDEANDTHSSYEAVKTQESA
jgi:hypothetical protein